MFKTYISKDFWLVQLLSGAALAAVLYFNIVPGAVGENLGLVQPVANMQVAQVVSPTAPATIVVSNLKELITAMGAAKNGDVIRLKSGVYDWFKATPYSITTKDSTISAVKPSNTAIVTVTSDDPNNRAVLRGMEITVPYWRFENLSFRIPKGGAAFTTYGAAHHLEIIGNDVSSENAADAKKWTKEEWTANTAGSFMTNTGPADSIIAYNNIRYVRWGIIAGAGTHVHDNKIVHLSGDASRAWGPGTIVENNYFANNYLIDGNHNDFIQSWVISPATSVGGVTVRNNSFIGLDAEASQMAISGLADSQGIGLFDGPYQDWVVENNLVVVTRQWHGISMYGGINSTIKNNLVADAIYTDTYGPAWLMLTNTKSGAVSTNTTVTDNYATSLSIAGASNSTGNVKIAFADYATYFKDAANYNWTIVPGSLPFSVGANIDMSKLAPEPYKDIVTPMDTTTVIPTNNTQGGVVTTTGGGTITPPPTLTLSLDATTLTTGSSATITWSTTNVTSCTASGSWSGSKSVNGSERIDALNAVGTFTYTLACTGTGGTITKEASLTVSAPTTVDGDGDGIADTSDNCPNAANANQSDRDNDGIGDICDSTPNGDTPTTLDFTVGDVVYTTTLLRVRTAAGLESKTYGLQKAGAEGAIIEGPIKLTNYTWYKVDFTKGSDGWVAGEYLQGM